MQHVSDMESYDIFLQGYKHASSAKLSLLHEPARINS